MHFLGNLAPLAGHLHPVWVHLPIGFLLLLATLEVCGLLARLPRFGWLPVITPAQRGLILVFSAAAAVVAAFFGWVLAHGGDFDSNRVGTHQWLGIAAAAAAVVALVVHRRLWLYAPVFVVTLVLLLAAGHAGASITHGSGYLTAYLPPSLARMFGVTAPAPAKKQAVHEFSQAVVFGDVIQPVLREKCVSCHGPDKSNGGLRVDSWEQLAKGGKHGPVFKPGDLAASELVRRIDLASDEKEHMPPRAKPQLTDDDVSILEWWVGAGAPNDKLFSVLNVPPAVDEVVRGRLGAQVPEVVPDRTATLAQAAAIASRLGLLIRPLTADGPWLDVNARVVGKKFGDREMAGLAPIFPAIQWLDLGGTEVTRAGLSSLASMRHLQRLHLDQCQIGDDALASLSPLTRLEYLNLRGTAITDAGLPSLRALPRLRALYVWQTAVTPGAVKALGEELTDRRRIARWKTEQAELEREIQAEHFEGNTGEALRPVAATPASSSP